MSALASLPETSDELSKRMWLAMLQGNHDLASRTAKRLLNMKPRHARARIVQAVLAWKRGDEAKGLELALDAYERDPDDIEILRVCGRQFKEAGKFANALQFYLTVAEKLPGNPQAKFDVAMCRLEMGDFARGWPETECRVPALLTKSPLRQAIEHRAMGEIVRTKGEWDGDPFPGPLLVMHDGGYGDCLMFARFLPAVLERVPLVVLKAPRALGPLLRTLPYGIEIDDGPKYSFPAFKRWVFLMSLPARLGIEHPSDVPGVPYLEVSRQVRKPTDLLRIALAWGGSPLNPRNHQRSLQPDDLAKILTIPGIEWHIVQQGPALSHLSSACRAAKLPPAFVVEHSDEIRDFSDTARILASCDLTLTVDTSIAHLSGALGLPTWVMVSTVPDYRWPWRSETTPWYPQAKLFRQIIPGNWDKVIGEVRAAMREIGNGIGYI